MAVEQESLRHLEVPCIRQIQISLNLQTLQIKLSRGFGVLGFWGFGGTPEDTRFLHVFLRMDRASHVDPRGSTWIHVVPVAPPPGTIHYLASCEPGGSVPRPPGFYFRVPGGAARPEVYFREGDLLCTGFSIRR